MNKLMQGDFKWQVPVHGILFPTATYQPPANVSLTVPEDSPILLMIPLYQEAASDSTTGAYSITLEDFDGSSTYWTPKQLIEVWDVTAGTQLTDWTLSGNTVSGTAPTAGDTVGVYYIPYRSYVRARVSYHSPSGVSQRPIYGGIFSDFVHTDFRKNYVETSQTVTLTRDDVLEILVQSVVDATFKPFNPKGELASIVRVEVPVAPAETSVV